MSRDETMVLPPDCETVVRELWAYLDGQVPERERGGLKAHLARCAYCRAHADFERRLADELAGLRRRHPDPERLRRRVLSTLREAGLE